MSLLFRCCCMSLDMLSNACFLFAGMGTKGRRTPSCIAKLHHGEVPKKPGCQAVPYCCFLHVVLVLVMTKYIIYIYIYTVYIYVYTVYIYMYIMYRHRTWTCHKYFIYIYIHMCMCVCVFAVPGTCTSYGLTLSDTSSMIFT